GKSVVEQAQIDIEGVDLDVSDHPAVDIADVLGILDVLRNYLAGERTGAEPLLQIIGERLGRRLSPGLTEFPVSGHGHLLLNRRREVQLRRVDRLEADVDLA